MVNILFLLSHTEKGGGEVVIYNLIKNLNRAQFRPFLGHVDFRKGTFIDEFKKLGVEPVDFHASRLRNLPVTLTVVLRLASFIRNNSIDIVFTSGAHNHIYAALAKKITGAAVITYVMNYYQERLKDNPLIMRLALRLGADYYILNSFMGLEALKKIIAQDTPCKVVYHGIDKDFINAQDKGALIRKHLGLSSENKLISVVARLQRWKSQDVFLQAASLIIKVRPQARFCLVGGALFAMDQDYPAELERLINKLGLTDRCWLVGHQENIRDWIAASDIIVQPLRIPEASSVALREAMFLGKPVVATSYGDSLEFIEDGISGILCKPDSPQDLASKIIKLLDNQDLADKIGQAARNIAVESFSAERMTREVEGVIKQVFLEKAGKKKVLFSFSTCKRSGHEMSMRNIIKVLDEEKFKPIAVFLCLREEGGFPDELRKMGVEIFIRRIGRLRQPLNVLRTVQYLIHLIKKENVKLIFTSGGHNHSYCRIASLFTRSPIIAHETFIFKRYLWQNGPIHALNFLLGIDAYVSCGRFASETLRRASLWKKPVHYLPFMVDREIFDYRKSGIGLRKGLNISADAFVFSMVARIQEWKGQDVFIEAAIQILKEAPDTYFLIFGEPTLKKDMLYLRFLKEKAESSAFTKQIIFAGLLEDSAYAYAASDVICHCSKTAEPFGMVITEAFAMKKPVIATAIGGPLETVEPGKDGYFVSPNNVEELVLAMKRCLKEKHQLCVLGEYGYKKARDIYGRENFSSRMNLIIARYIQR